MMMNPHRTIPLRQTAVLAIVLATSVWSIAADDAGGARSEPAQAAAPAPAILQKETLRVGKGVSRVAANFLVLMRREWKELGDWMRAVLAQAMLWGLGAWLGGSFLGYALYRALRKKPTPDRPARWRRLTRWMWPAFFIVSMGSGLGYAGLWWGGGRAFNHQIRERRALDRIVAHLICAVLLDRVQYEAKGEETVAKFAQVLGDSETVDRLAEEDFSRGLKDLQEKLPGSFMQAWWLPVISETGLTGLLTGVQGIHPRMLFVMLMDHPNLDEYVRQHPQANPALIALSMNLRVLRQNACLWTNQVVYPNVIVGVAAGLGLPLLSFGMFRFVLWLWSFIRSFHASAPGATATERGEPMRAKDAD